MSKRSTFSSVWMRILIFIWMIVFPIVFVAIPTVEILLGEREFELMPLWAFAIWIAAPLVVAIVMKNWGGGSQRNQ